MVSKKLSTEEQLEKELKTLVSKMKNENTALNKILVQLKSKEVEMLIENDDTDEPGKK